MLMLTLPAESYHVVAERINTGTSAPDTSRALVVFNLTDEPIAGPAVFHAFMSWPVGTPLPPVAVMDMDGTRVTSSITDWTEGPDAKGRADRRQLSFAIRFAVSDVPAQGWRTYIAAYVSEPVPNPNADLTETAGLVVLETTRHEGDLPPVGTFADCSPSMVQ